MFWVPPTEEEIREEQRRKQQIEDILSRETDEQRKIRMDAQEREHLDGEIKCSLCYKMEMKSTYLAHYVTHLEKAFSKDNFP